MSENAPRLLAVAGITKRYGSVAALTDASIDFAPSEIHAVLGENGAGKSTLMGVLSGFVMPDRGRVTLDDRPIPLGRAFECRRRGIEMVHQHFTLVAEFTVAENFALARLPRLVTAANVMERAKSSLDAAERLGWLIDANAKIRTLAVGARQRIEILKALGGDARVLILDEPTAVLSAPEVDDLFRVLRRLRDEGRIVILIAHKLSEVLDVADKITVLRRGRLVSTVARLEADPRQLAEWMVGELPESKTRSKAELGRTGGLSIEDLHVRGDRGEPSVRGVNFEVKKGEIVGIGGVDGNGQIELAEALAGIRAVSRGSQIWRGSEKPSAGYIPQDRQLEGLALNMTVEENLLVGGFRRSRLRRGPFLRMAEVRRWARDVITRFDVRVGSQIERVSNLSGGNQQKVVVGRTLDASPELLVAVNPTRGLDFRATQFVHDRIRNARDDGGAVVLFSTDVDEIYSLADRRYFMSRGELLAGDSASAYLGGSKADEV